MIFRKVIKSEEYKPIRTARGAFGIEDTLECGHVIYNKGSAGHANRRKCRNCTDFQLGYSHYSILGNVIETWDPDTQLPVRREMTERKGDDIILPLREGHHQEYHMPWDKGHRHRDRRRRKKRRNRLSGLGA